VTQANGVQSQLSPYRLERIPGKRMTVRIFFDGEEGLLRGTQAERLSLLIRQERVHWMELAGSLPALRNSHSVVSASEIEMRNGEDHVQAGGRDVRVQDELERANVRLAQLRIEIEEAPNDVERDELERERQQLLDTVRRLARTGSGETQRAKRAVIRDINRAKEDLEESMPNFVSHLRSAIRPDEASDEYVYTPGYGITWEYSGF
jgi:hypothetical protein